MDYCAVACMKTAANKLEVVQNNAARCNFGSTLSIISNRIENTTWLGNSRKKMRAPHCSLGVSMS